VYYLGLWRKKCRKAFWLAQGCRLTPSTLDITMCVRPIPTVTPIQSHHTGFPAMDLTGFMQISSTFNMAHLNSKNCILTFSLSEKKISVDCVFVIMQPLLRIQNFNLCMCTHARARTHTHNACVHTGMHTVRRQTHMCTRTYIHRHTHTHTVFTSKNSNHVEQSMCPFIHSATVLSKTVKGFVI
jgi:hypothetical protein